MSKKQTKEPNPGEPAPAWGDDSKWDHYTGKQPSPKKPILCGQCKREGKPQEPFRSFEALKEHNDMRHRAYFKQVQASLGPRDELRSDTIEPRMHPALRVVQESKALRNGGGSVWSQEWTRELRENDSYAVKPPRIYTDRSDLERIADEIAEREGHTIGGRDEEDEA